MLNNMLYFIGTCVEISFNLICKVMDVLGIVCVLIIFGPLILLLVICMFLIGCLSKLYEHILIKGR